MEYSFYAVYVDGVMQRSLRYVIKKYNLVKTTVYRKIKENMENKNEYDYLAYKGLTIKIVKINQ
jgi:hypothetical protein